MSKRFWAELNEPSTVTTVTGGGGGKKSKKVTVVKKSYSSKSSGKGLAGAVKSVLASSAEKKTSGKIISFTVGGGNYGSNTNFYVTPDTAAGVISQGTGIGSRIGNKVQTVRARIKGHFAPAPYNASSNPLPSPCWVRMYILSSKDQPVTNVNPSAVSVPFYRTGQTTFKMNGALTDPWADVNKDAFTLHKSMLFKVGAASYVENPGQSAGVGYYSNNDVSIGPSFDIDITPYFPKHIEWNDTTALPTSRAVYVALEATPIVQGTSNSQPVLFYGDVIFDYIDV